MDKTLHLLAIKAFLKEDEEEKGKYSFISICYFYCVAAALNYGFG